MQTLLTYLFSDIVGSTALWEGQPAAMRADLARHDELMHASIAAHHGTIFKTAGDAFYATFRRPRDAFAAACNAQRTLQTTSWSVSGGITVRMAIHTGESEQRDGDFFGAAVSRTARLLGLADAGHVIVSDATAQLLRETTDASIDLYDHGFHVLKGFTLPARVFQARYDAPLGDVRPLCVPLPSYRSNLPPQPKALIGRERAIDTLTERVASEQLVTIAGFGGVGKSALALQVASAVRARYPDGTWIVDLVNTADAEMVAAQIAGPLGTGSDALLVIDNSDRHIESVARAVRDLRQSRPQLHILTTSREALQLDGEAVWRVAPLDTPAATALMIERLSARDQTFEVTRTAQRAIDEIVTTLDGIPLAIEFAAARFPGLGVTEIAAKLGDRFRLLRSSDRGANVGRRTLREVLAWSFDGLSRDEQLLLKQLTIFPGSWTLDAAEFVCRASTLDPDDIYELLSQVVEKSLVESEGAERRYRLLGTVRAYAAALDLDAAPPWAQVERLQADYAAAQVAAAFADTELGPDARRTLFDRDFENFLAAIRFYTEGGESERALRLTLDLRELWIERGHPLQGRIVLTRVIDLFDPKDTRTDLIAARMARAVVNNILGAFDEARIEAQVVLTYAIETNDVKLTADALNTLGFSALRLGETEDALALYERGREVSAGVYLVGEARALYNLGVAAANRGDTATARAFYERSIALFRDTRDRWRIAFVLNGLARLSFESGDIAAGRAAAEEALAVRLDIEDRGGIIDALALLAQIDRTAGDDESAKMRLRLLFTSHWLPEFTEEAGDALDVVADWLLATGRAREAAMIDGTRAAFTPASRMESVGPSSAERETRLRAALGDRAFELEHAAGELIDPADIPARLARYWD